MDLSRRPPQPPVSPLSETSTGGVIPKTKSYISCRTSSGIPRASFATISSQSITVFADVKDLPSRSGSHRSEPYAPDVGIENETLNLTLSRQSYQSIETISSFGFEVSMPEPVFGGGRALTNPQLDQNLPSRQNVPRKVSFRSPWSSKNTGRNIHNLSESFPRPPSKGLLSFATVFPQIPQISQEKQTICVDKSLPPPPYHVFDTPKKKGIMFLMALVGVLTPMSTFIYFPALGDISRVSVSPALFISTYNFRVFI